jgi:hypothetical protein
MPTQTKLVLGPQLNAWLDEAPETRKPTRRGYLEAGAPGALALAVALRI